MPAPRIKICCIQDLAEAELAARAGAWALGLVAEMPSGQGPISDARIAEIARAAPPGVETFLLTSRVRAGDIIEHHRVCRTSTLQLVDAVAQADLAQIRRALPGVRLVQVVHVTGPEALDQAAALAGRVDALLLDSGQPDAAVRELGGTGRTHDWSLSREIVRRSALPVWLAGGLRPENVGQAIRQVRPWGVDLCSGIRVDGRLDPSRLDAFVRAVRQADTGERA